MAATSFHRASHRLGTLAIGALMLVALSSGSQAAGTRAHVAPKAKAGPVSAQQIFERNAGSRAQYSGGPSRAACQGGRCASFTITGISY